MFGWLRRFVAWLKCALSREYVECEFCGRHVKKCRAMMLLPSCDYIDPVNFICTKHGGDCIFFGDLWCCEKCYQERFGDGGDPYVYVYDVCLDIQEAAGELEDEWEYEEEVW